MEVDCPRRCTQKNKITWQWERCGAFHHSVVFCSSPRRGRIAILKLYRESTMPLAAPVLVAIVDGVSQLLSQGLVLAGFSWSCPACVASCPEIPACPSLSCSPSLTCPGQARAVVDWAPNAGAWTNGALIGFFTGFVSAILLFIIIHRCSLQQPTPAIEEVVTGSPIKKKEIPPVADAPPSVAEEALRQAQRARDAAQRRSRAPG